MSTSTKIPDQHSTRKPYIGPNYTISELVSRTIDMRNQEPERVKFSELLAGIKKRSPEMAATKIQSIHRGQKAREQVEQKRTKMQEEPDTAQKAKKEKDTKDETRKPKGVLGAKTNVSLFTV